MMPDVCVCVCVCVCVGCVEGTDAGPCAKLLSLVFGVALARLEEATPTDALRVCWLCDGGREATL